jgi:hypothetical protein
MNITNGSNSIILFISDFIKTIGSSHSNHSISNRGKFIFVTGVPSQKLKLLSKILNDVSFALFASLYSLIIISFSQCTKKFKLVMIVDIMIIVIFFNI